MTWNIVDISFYVYAFFIPYPGRTFHIYPCLHQSPYIFTPRYFIRLCFFLVFPPKSCCGYLHGFSFFGDFLCSVCVAVRIVIEACYLRKELNASFAFPQLHRANIPSIEGVQYFGSRVVISIYTSSRRVFLSAGMQIALLVCCGYIEFQKKRDISSIWIIE